MDDLISRQMAVDALGTPHGIMYPIRTIESLPSAQPEPQKGKWENYVISMLDGEGCRCSECGFEGVPYWDYCPNCGADRREENDG